MIYTSSGAAANGAPWQVAYPMTKNAIHALALLVGKIEAMTDYPRGVTLNVGTNVGYAIEAGDFTAWTTKVGLDWAFVEKAKLSPFVAVSLSLSDDWNPDDEFVAGSMLSVSF